MAELDMDESIESKIESIDNTLGTISITVGKNSETLMKLSEKVESQGQLIRQLFEFVTNHSQMGQVISSGGAPLPVGTPSAKAALMLPLNLHTLEVTLRPYKKLAADKVRGYGFNPTPTLPALFQLISFEEQYPGSFDSVIDIITTSMVGWSNGVKPLDWDAAQKDPKIASAAAYAFSQQQGLKSILADIAKPDFLNKIENKNTVATLMKRVSTMLSNGTLECIAGARDNLASLFQQHSIPHGVYQPSESRAGAVVKAPLMQTYLGRAFVARLGQDVVAKISPGSFRLDEPVPLIQFAPLAATAASSAPQNAM